MTRDAKTLLLIGAGKLGGDLLDHLARSFPWHRYVVIARNAEQLEKRVNLSRFICSKWGAYPHIEGISCNILSTDYFSEKINTISPDIVFNATTPFPWWKIAAMPQDKQILANSVGPGIWCALDAILPFNICRSIKGSGLKTIFVNGCYPDLTNAFLKEEPNAPIIGIGNVSNLIPGLKYTFAKMHGLKASEINIRLVCHHFTSLNAPTVGGCVGAPYYLEVQLPDGKIIYKQKDEPFRQLKTLFPRVRGLDGQGVTVASAASVVATMLNGEDRFLHAPGALGLPGGYPVHISRNADITLDLGELSENEAIKINEAAQKYDGIEDVTAGMITPTEQARQAFHKIVGLELPNIDYTNLAQISSETVSLLNKQYDLGVWLS